MGYKFNARKWLINRVEDVYGLQNKTDDNYRKFIYQIFYNEEIKPYLKSASYNSLTPSIIRILMESWFFNLCFCSPVIAVPICCEELAVELCIDWILGADYGK
ncbi:MAG: hypothetical protein ACI35W_05505 [Anaeroplasmataceae bacterium]